MTQGQKLTGQERTRVIALLLTGETIAATAKLSGVSVKSVERIKSSPEMAQLVAIKRQSEPSLNELVTDHLTTSLQATIALARRIATDDEWFGRQSASDVAMMYSRMSDSAIRIFTAKLRAEELAHEKLQLEAENEEA